LLTQQRINDTKTALQLTGPFCYCLSHWLINIPSFRYLCTYRRLSAFDMPKRKTLLTVGRNYRKNIN